MTDTGHDLSRLRIERSTPAGGPSAWPWVLLVVVVLAAAVAWWRWGGGSDPRPLVALGRVQLEGGASARSGTAANGYVVARRRAALSTDIQGRLVEMLVEEGDVVEEGQLIARLDTRQLEAGLARTQADLQRARASADFAASEFERLSKLQHPLDVSESRLDQAEAEAAKAAAEVQSLEAAVREIEVMIQKSSVYAPFSGVIVEKNAEVGEVVSAIGATGPQSRGAVATLVDFATLEVQVELAQTSLRAAREGAPVMIYLDAFPDHGYPGRVRQIWPTANRQKATVELRAVFLERDQRILPEMGVRVVFVEGEVAPAGEEPEVWVPASAVVDGDEPFVFVYSRADGIVLRQPVELGDGATGGRRPVLRGLEGNEQVVLDPPAGLVEGQAVRTDG